MKSKITLIIASVALVTLSFTFAGVTTEPSATSEKPQEAQALEPIGGIVSDEVVL